RLTGEKSLVAGDQDVREGEQPGEYVVLNHGAGEVLVEEIGLLLVDVEPEGADPATLQRLDHRARVDQPSPARVDEDHARLHPLQSRLIDQVMCGGGEGEMERNDVGRGEQLLQGYVLTPDFEYRVVRVRIVRKDPAAEAVHDPGEHRADLARADHSDSLPVEVEAEQPVQREVALAHPGVRAVELPVEGEEQPHRVLRDRVRRVCRDANDGDPRASRVLEVPETASGANITVVRVRSEEHTS